jgi:hypothetical protein
MRNLKLSVMYAVLFVATVAGVSSTAKANWPWFPNYYSGYSGQSIPYFALHPPVYYSYPVPRPYGYSPFAYPPGVLTPEVSVQVSPPKTIHNSYVPRPSSVNQDRSASRAVTPQLVINPYFERSDAAGVAQSEN